MHVSVDTPRYIAVSATRSRHLAIIEVCGATTRNPTRTKVQEEIRRMTRQLFRPEELEVSSEEPRDERHVAGNPDVLFAPKYPVASSVNASPICTPDTYDIVPMQYRASHRCVLEYPAEYFSAITNKPGFALRISPFVCGFLR